MAATDLIDAPSPRTCLGLIGLGAALAVAVLDVSPTWSVAVGAAPGMTAGTGLIFSPMLFGMLLIGSAGLEALPAPVLAAVAAWLTKHYLARCGSSWQETP